MDKDPKECPTCMLELAPGNSTCLMQNNSDMRQVLYNLSEGLQRCWDNELSYEELKDLIGNAKDLLKEMPDGSQ